MKSRVSALLSLLLAAPLVAPLMAQSNEQLIPAGSLLSCTVSEPKLSSKTADVGDPVLCRVSHVELYGRSTLPYGTYLVGRFEDYKDPGHLVGKGWMELKFDRMVVQPDTVIPVDAKVVYVKGYNVDKQGRILGKGHPVRDTLEWMVPVLWPIDLINLPRRGPRPVLKEETRLELKLMDDIGVPLPGNGYGYQQQQPGLARRAPTAYEQPAPAPIEPAYARHQYEREQQQQAPVVVQNYYSQPAQQPQQYVQQAYAPQPRSVMVPVPYGNGYVMRRVTGPYAGPGYAAVPVAPPPAYEPEAVYPQPY